MWRLYRGGAPLELAQIYNFMGGAGSGTSPGQIRSATACYAGVNDAYVDYGAQDPEALKREFFARQITSVSAHAPVIVIAESGFHAVVLKGGSWSKDAQGLLNVWDDEYFNDPKWLYERYQSSADWTEDSLGGYNLYIQVISNAAVYSGEENNASYGDLTVDSSGEPTGPEDQNAY